MIHIGPIFHILSEQDNTSKQLELQLQRSQNKLNTSQTIHTAQEHKGSKKPSRSTLLSDLIEDKNITIARLFNEKLLNKETLPGFRAWLEENVNKIILDSNHPCKRIPDIQAPSTLKPTRHNQRNSASAHTCFTIMWLLTPNKTLYQLDKSRRDMFLQDDYIRMRYLLLKYEQNTKQLQA